MDTITSPSVPPELLALMTERSRADAGFPGPVTEEHRQRTKLIADLARSVEPPLPEVGPAADELRRMRRDFDDAFRARHPDGMVDAVEFSAIHFPTWRRRFPPYDYAFAGPGNAQVKQAFPQNGNVFVNCLSGQVASGQSGRVTGISTVGVEISHDTYGWSATEVFAHIDWGASWDMSVTGGLIGTNPWCEAHVRLNLLVWEESGYVTGTGPQEVFGVHHEDDPGGDVTHWAEKPQGQLTLRSPVFALPPSQKRWVNIDLYVEANCGYGAASGAACWALSSSFLRDLFFYPR